MTDSTETRRIEIYHDEDAESPREGYNLGTMICFHNRYRLGDEHDFRSDDYASWTDLEKGILKAHPGGVILPLYLYDHSGITMSTTPFSCPWDSGQVGFIVASAEKIRAAYGVKRITKKVREKAIQSLKSEVKVYDDFICGNVYGFAIFDENGNWADGCNGFIGSDLATNGMLDHIPADLREAAREAFMSM